MRALPYCRKTIETANSSLLDTERDYRQKYSKHLPLSAEGSNPDRYFGFFQVRKLFS
jgi:hypothetical protein